MLFWIDVVVNQQSVRLWVTERPMEHNSMSFTSSGVITRYMMSNKLVIDFYYFENDNFAGEIYRIILILCVFHRFWEIRDYFVFQQDSAFPQYSNRGKERANKKLPDSLTRRGGPILWQPGSLGLAPCDFFGWEFIISKI